MSKFIVKNTTILHNKKTYGIGDTIEFPDDFNVAKLADYLTPIEIVAESNSGETPTPKATKSNKKADKAATTTDTTTEATATAADATASTEEVKPEGTKEEALNGTETV